jgi:hypothetical protein
LSIYIPYNFNQIIAAPDRKHPTLTQLDANPSLSAPAADKHAGGRQHRCEANRDPNCIDRQLLRCELIDGLLDRPDGISHEKSTILFSGRHRLHGGKGARKSLS